MTIKPFSKLALVLILPVVSLNYLLGQSNSNIFTYKSIDHGSNDFSIKYVSDYVDITSFLPRDHVKNGTVDYTSYIQKAIDEFSNIIFPNFPIMINDGGLKLKSNSNIYFQKKSSIVMEPSAKSKFSFFHLNGITNVNIYNPQLIGEREKHLNDKGEWGMGISILGSTNIKVYNVKIKSTWGDGIYVNSLGDIQSDSILIKDGYIDNVRRNGISIISGKKITIDNILISNVNGALPSSGIDIEPNHPKDILDNIVLQNIKTFNNHSSGILIVLTRIGNPHFNKEISIDIKNHYDKYSYYAMRFGSGFRKNDKALVGKINIENSQWSDTRSENIIGIIGNLNNLPIVSFKNIKINGGKGMSFETLLKQIQINSKSFQIIK